MLAIMVDKARNVVRLSRIDAHLSLAGLKPKHVAIRIAAVLVDNLAMRGLVAGHQFSVVFENDFPFGNGSKGSHAKAAAVIRFKLFK